MKKKTKAVRRKKKLAPGSGPEKLIVVSLKMTSRDLRNLKLAAKRFAKGNLSAWFRYTGLKYVPKKGESIPQNPFKR